MTLDAYQRYQEAQPTAEPAPTPTPKPTPTPRPTVPPTITKDPVGETVQEGDSCLFVAKEEGAVTAVWHFLSPDGKIDIEYSAASKQFPPLEVYGGDTGTITLTEIPLSLNKWKVYCRFTNEYGISDTKTAKILVTVKPTPTPKPTKAPKPTVEPTVEPTLTPSLGPVVNEWVETTSLQEAIDGSGVNFDPPQAMSVLGDLRFKTYRYRTGTIEVIHTDKFDMDDHVLTIRKSTANAGESLLGDYNSYSATWDLSIKGLTVHCKGDGETANNVWFDGGGAHYAILFRPGHEGSGLTPDDINSLVNGMQ